MFFFHHTDDRRIIRRGVANAALAAAYVGAVVLLLSNAQRLFGQGEDRMLVPFAMLMLFVVSAAVTGGLVFGMPLLWYLDGKKREAVRLAAWTVAALAALTALLFAALALTRV
ncbi:MAG TPA: hypothetical protein VLC10_01970 [Patescibacteria group bacterium]|nr:hypothetical protein [Patescibacteria group bacterium]